MSNNQILSDIYKEYLELEYMNKYAFIYKLIYEPDFIQTIFEETGQEDHLDKQKIIKFVNDLRMKQGFLDKTKFLADLESLMIVYEYSPEDDIPDFGSTQQLFNLDNTNMPPPSLLHKLSIIFNLPLNYFYQTIKDLIYHSNSNSIPYQLYQHYILSLEQEDLLTFTDFTLKLFDNIEFKNDIKNSLSEDSELRSKMEKYVDPKLGLYKKAKFVNKLDHLITKIDLTPSSISKILDYNISNWLNLESSSAPSFQQLISLGNLLHVDPNQLLEINISLPSISRKVKSKSVKDAVYVENLDTIPKKLFDFYNEHISKNEFIELPEFYLMLLTNQEFRDTFNIYFGLLASNEDLKLLDYINKIKENPLIIKKVIFVNNLVKLSEIKDLNMNQIKRVYDSIYKMLNLSEKSLPSKPSLGRLAKLFQTQEKNLLTYSNENVLTKGKETIDDL